MDYRNAKQRIEAAQKLLTASATSQEKFFALKTLLTGINPRLDRTLATCAQALSTIEKLEKGDVIELSAEHLPEETAEQKKRKKALILFLRSWKNLKTEVGRVGKELDTQNESPSQRQQTRSVARIISGAKGPLGVITIIAVVAVVASQFVSPKTATLKVIQVSDKSIPLDALVVASGTECQNNAPHYHATDHQAARALDGTMVPDPGGCGYGTVSQTQIVEVTP